MASKKAERVSRIVNSKHMSREQKEQYLARFEQVEKESLRDKVKIGFLVAISLSVIYAVTWASKWSENPYFL